MSSVAKNEYIRLKWVCGGVVCQSGFESELSCRLVVEVKPKPRSIRTYDELVKRYDSGISTLKPPNNKYWAIRGRGITNRFVIRTSVKNKILRG